MPISSFGRSSARRRPQRRVKPRAAGMLLWTLLVPFTPVEAQVLDVTGVDPTTLQVGSAEQLTVTGSGFLDGATVRICPQPDRVVVDAVVFVDGGTLLVDVSVSPTAATGPCGLRVTNPGGEADVLPAAITISDGSPPPVILEVTPSTLAQGESGSLTLGGTGFASGATVRVCSDGRVTVDAVQFIDSTMLVAEVVVPIDATAGLCLVRVRNPDAQAAVLRDAVEIVPPAPASEPLIEYLFEDDPGGLSVANTGSLGSAADGTLDGPVDHPVFTSMTPFGTGQAVFFGDPDGAGGCVEGDQSGWVRIPDVLDYIDPVSLQPLQELTIEAWVWLDFDTLSQTIFHNLQAGGASFDVTKRSLDFQVATDEDPSGIRLEGGAVVSGVWQHLAAVYDGQQMRVYLDGEDTCFFQLTTGGLGDPSVSPTLGGVDDPDLPFFLCGALDDFRLHPRALQPSELADGLFDETVVCPICGDSILEAPEACDPPGSSCSNGSTCTETCRCIETFDGTTWTVDILDIETREVVDTDVFTFIGGTFASDNAAHDGCTLDSFDEREVIIQDIPRLRFTATFSCPAGPDVKFDGITPCMGALCSVSGGFLETMGGWVFEDSVRTWAIEGVVVP